MRCPLEAARAREVQVGTEGVAHRVDEALRPARREAVLPPEVEHFHVCAVAVDPRLDAADEAVAEDHGQHVPAPTPLRRRVKELPDVVEAEQRAEEAAVPDQRIEGRQERDGVRRRRRRLQQLHLVSEDEPLLSQPLDLDGDELAGFDQLLSQRVAARVVGPPAVGLRRPDAAEDVVSAADAEEAVRAVSREKLVA